jgi:hypothetical protein
MKRSRLTEASIPDLARDGFHQLKPHEFARVRNGTVQFLSFQGVKRDIHIWVNALPLSLPGLWLSMGWRNAAGRAPSAAGSLNLEADTEMEVNRIQTLLRDALIQEAVPRLDSMDSLATLHDSFDEALLPFAAWPKAFCMLQSGNIAEGKMHLEKVLNDPLRGQQHPIASKYMESDAPQVAELIEQQTAENVERCRIRKLWR